MPHASPIEVLLVEDSPTDQLLTLEALGSARLMNRVHTVADGVEAMAFLRREDRYADAPRPDVVLLDLNLPRKDGREVLAEMKADPRLASIPVVVLTSSESPDDIAAVYQLQASCYVAKPVDFEAFRHVVQSIEHFWFAVVRLPPVGAGGR